MAERIIDGTQFNVNDIMYTTPKATPQGAKSVNILNKKTKTGTIIHLPPKDTRLKYAKEITLDNMKNLNKYGNHGLIFSSFVQLTTRMYILLMMVCK